MAWDRDKERKAGKAMTLGSSIFGLIFAIFWCAAAVSMGAGFMLLFGIPFVGMMIYRIYVISQYAREDEKKALPKESTSREHPAAPMQENTAGSEGKFCPYCGGGIQEGFTFCPKCGRRQP